MAVFSDGRLAKFNHWAPEQRGETRRAVLALHGFTDYSAAFNFTALQLNRLGYEVFAYDQRGFGAPDARRLECDDGRLLEDVFDAATLLRQSLGPEDSLVLLGESMGGAVALAAAHEHDLQIDGLVLAPPAVWTGFYGRSVLRWTAQLAAQLLPGLEMEVTRIGDSGVIAPSRQRLQRDPKARAVVTPDVVRTLLSVMERASTRRSPLKWPTLCLYGSNDAFLARAWIEQRFRRDPLATIASFPGGCHLILQDRQREAVYGTVRAWLEEKELL